MGEEEREKQTESQIRKLGADSQDTELATLRRAKQEQLEKVKQSAIQKTDKIRIEREKKQLRKEIKEAQKIRKRQEFEKKHPRIAKFIEVEKKGAKRLGGIAKKGGGAVLRGAGRVGSAVEKKAFGKKNPFYVKAKVKRSGSKKVKRKMR